MESRTAEVELERCDRVWVCAYNCSANEPVDALRAAIGEANFNEHITASWCNADIGRSAVRVMHFSPSSRRARFEACEQKRSMHITRVTFEGEERLMFARAMLTDELFEEADIKHTDGGELDTMCNAIDSNQRREVGEVARVTCEWLRWRRLECWRLDQNCSWR